MHEDEDLRMLLSRKAEISASPSNVEKELGHAEVLYLTGQASASDFSHKLSPSAQEELDFSARYTSWVRDLGYDSDGGMNTPTVRAKTQLDIDQFYKLFHAQVI